MTREEVDEKVAEAQDKAQQLSKESNDAGGLKYGPVTTIIVEKTGADKATVEEVIVGFMKKPTRAAKMMGMNYIAKQEIDRAGEVILTSSLIKEVSDPRLSDVSTDDNVFMSAALICVAEIEVYSAYVKKN